jgi:hypothetical protein
MYPPPQVLRLGAIACVIAVVRRVGLRPDIILILMHYSTVRVMLRIGVALDGIGQLLMGRISVNEIEGVKNGVPE